MTMKKQKKMSREEAMELYQELQNSVSAIMRGKAPPKVSRPGAKTEQPRRAPAAQEPMFDDAKPQSHRDRGAIAAVTFVLFCAMVKVAVGVIDYLGIFEAIPAQASMQMPRHAEISAENGFSPDEIKLLTSLDARRSELEERSKMLDTREQDINKRDKEYVAKLAEIRDLTDKLHLEREKSEKKKSTELDQLANVYGSMAPQEAAQLIEQLDVTIALPLLKRMPEKRMGQILPLMSPDRALSITKLLSGS